MNYGSLRIGLALGSGGSKGLSHIGVLKALEKAKIPIYCIAGTSIGALIGGYYALEKDISQLESIIFSNRWHEILDLLFDPSFGGGLNSGKKIEKYIRNKIQSASFSDLKIPFCAIATDLQSGDSVTFSAGDVTLALRASISVPLVFKPIEHQGHFLADGGLSNPVPVDIARKMGAQKVIAVNLDANYFSSDVRKRTNIYALSHRAINILRYNKAKSCVKDADIVLEPKVPDSGLVGWKDFLNPKQCRMLIQAGEDAMNEQLGKL